MRTAAVLSCLAGLAAAAPAKDKITDLPGYGKPKTGALHHSEFSARLAAPAAAHGPPPALLQTTTAGTWTWQPRPKERFTSTTGSPPPSPPPRRMIRLCSG